MLIFVLKKKDKAPNSHKNGYSVNFLRITQYNRHSQHTHTHPCEHTCANPTPRSIFIEDWVGKSSRLTKPPQAPHCRREHRLLLKEQILYTIQRRHSQRMHTHPYEHTRANPTCRIIFVED
jgi:hypothetical protein